MEKVKWGIIGAGDVCEVKGGPPLYLADHSDVITVMRRNAEKVKDFAKRHQIPKWTTNAEELIGNPEINAIYIATPPDSHSYYTNLAAKAGKHIYVEKPMARTYEETKWMTEICKQNNVKLFVAYYRRYLPNFRFVKKMIDSGVLGKILSVDICVRQAVQPEILNGIIEKENWRVNPAISGGGYFHDLASHQLDMMDFLFGPIVSASGITRNLAGYYKADDYTAGYFEFENGIPGFGEWNFCVPADSEKEETTIFGTKGTISFPFFGDHSVTVCIEGKKETHYFNMPKHIQFPLIQAIVNDLRGFDSCLSTGESGARTNKVMDWLTG